jgi:hypothetical protein
MADAPVAEIHNSVTKECHWLGTFDTVVTYDVSAVAIV